VVTGKPARNVTAERIHDHARQTLGLSHGTILVRQQESLQTHDFFSQLADLTRECVVLGGKQFHLGL
jgi:hypothetical protein